MLGIFFLGRYEHFSLRKYPANTRNRACEWLRFPDWLEHAQIARARDNKEEKASTTRLEREASCVKPRYLRNANSRRNGTCERDNIARSLDSPSSSDRSAEDLLRDLLLTSPHHFILLFGTRVLYRSGIGDLPGKMPITFSVEFDLERISLS